jgi:hypothetical protein
MVVVSEGSRAMALDRSLNSAFLQPFSQFCRVHLCTLKALDLESRLKRPHRPVLLRFPARSKPSPRHCEIRAGYGFCPSCIAQDSIIHVRWDWCFAGLIRCPVHDIALDHLASRGGYAAVVECATTLSRMGSSQFDGECYRQCCRLGSGV